MLCEFLLGGVRQTPTQLFDNIVYTIFSTFSAKFPHFVEPLFDMCACPTIRVEQCPIDKVYIDWTYRSILTRSGYSFRCEHKMFSANLYIYIISYILYYIIIYYFILLYITLYYIIYYIHIYIIYIISYYINFFFI